MGLAFLDVSMYVTSLTVFKNLILIGDFVKSLVFATLQENPYKFTTVARDLTDRSLVSADFLVMEGASAFVTCDRNGDLRLLAFDPADPDSLNGEKLILKTEFHCASPLTASKTIARRRTAEEEVAPQTQLIYGEWTELAPPGSALPSCKVFEVADVSHRGRRTHHPRGGQDGARQAPPARAGPARAQRAA